MNRLLVKSACQKNFLICSSKIYVVGTQKNRLIETVLLSTQNIYVNQSTESTDGDGCIKAFKQGGC